MSANPTNLNEILTLCRTRSAQNIRSLAVFDLDSTLFNVSTRTQKILHEFAETHNRPDLLSVEVQHRDWGIKEALLRAGYSLEKDADSLTQLREFWSARFFSSEYLHYDVPYAGSVAFVQELASTGCEIAYLTGRDAPRMQKGTLEVLEKWGLPIADKRMLHMKPEKKQDDEVFKLDWFKKLDASAYESIFFFENEPININAVLTLSLPVQVIYVDTTHSRKENVTGGVLTVQDFQRAVC